MNPEENNEVLPAPAPEATEEATPTETAPVETAPSEEAAPEAETVTEEETFEDEEEAIPSPIGDDEGFGEEAVV